MSQAIKLGLLDERLAKGPAQPLQHEGHDEREKGYRCCLDQDRRGEKNPRYFVGSALISCVVNDLTFEHTKCLTTPHSLARPIESTEVDSNKLQINFKSLLIPSDPLNSVSEQSNSIQIHLKPIHILANLFNY
jgi:hypothetical protein